MKKEPESKGPKRVIGLGKARIAQRDSFSLYAIREYSIMQWVTIAREVSDAHTKRMPFWMPTLCDTLDVALCMQILAASEYTS